MRPATARILDALAQGPATARELAQRTGLSESTIRARCLTLTSLGEARVVGEGDAPVGRKPLIYEATPSGIRVARERRAQREHAGDRHVALLRFIEASSSNGVRRTEVQERLGLGKGAALYELRRLVDLGLIDRYWIAHGHGLAGDQVAHSRWTIRGVRCRLGVHQ